MRHSPTKKNKKEGTHFTTMFFQNLLSKSNQKINKPLLKPDDEIWKEIW